MTSGPDGCGWHPVQATTLCDFDPACPVHGKAKENLMTPTETLRAAADTLRTHALAASPGPWHVNAMGSVETSEHQELADVWQLQAAPDANARHIALMHPGVAAALSEWLDHSAATAQRSHGLFADSGSPDEFVHDYALGIARLILRSAP